MKKLFNLIFLILFTIASINLIGQESVATSGGDSYSIYGNISYTLGQVFYDENKNSNVSVTGGVQQAFSIFEYNREEKNILLKIKSYPNPTTDFLSLEINDIEDYDFSYAMIDIRGKILHTQKIKQKKSTIDMTEFSVGNYILSVIDHKKPIKMFKIIKH